MTIAVDAAADDATEISPNFPPFFTIQATSIVADMNGTLWKVDLATGTVALVVLALEIADGGSTAH